MHSQCLLRFIRVWFVTSMLGQDKKHSSVISATVGNTVHVTQVRIILVHEEPYHKANGYP